jgi:circadian clock protein KaiB
MGTGAVVTGQFEQWFERSQRERYELRLFVAGMTVRSAATVERIKQLCEEHLRGRYELEVVDIHQQPELAQEYQIFAVPTLVKKSPTPIRRLIGDFSDVKKVLRGLDVRVKR